MYFLRTIFQVSHLTLLLVFSLLNRKIQLFVQFTWTPCPNPSLAVVVHWQFLLLVRTYLSDNSELK